MNGKREKSDSAVWSKYVDAKRYAKGEPDGKEAPMTLEELERAIAEAAAQSGLQETGMPPRSEVHPVKRSQISRWFYLTLVVLFAGLVVGLVLWGRENNLGL